MPKVKKTAYYNLINEVNNYALLAARPFGFDGEDEHLVVQHPLSLSHAEGKPGNKEAFAWILILAEEDRRGDYYYIINKVSGYGLLAGRWGRKDRHDVAQFPLSALDGKPENIKAFNWLLEMKGTIELPEREDIENPKVTPKLTSLTQPPEHYEEVRLAKTSYIPCWMVDDTKDLQWRLKYSPYYVMERKQRYRKAAWTYNPSSDKDDELKYKVTTGFTKEQSNTFSATTGFSVTSSVEAGVEGVAKAGISTTISAELGFSTGTSISNMKSEEAEVTVKVPPLTACAIYVLSSEYTLRRADGDKVQDTWSIDDSKDLIKVYYPQV